MLTPGTEERLLELAAALRGRRLGELAAELGAQVPPDLRRHKGWVGHLVERALGAPLTARGRPDFPHLGVELKTIPVAESGRPLQSTWVCVAPLDGGLARTWEQSRARAKLAAVLWVPVEGRGELSERRVRAPFLWRPSPAQEARLRADWEALAELIGLGEIWQLDAHKGEVLQIRPKAAHSRELVWILDQEGEWVRTSPRGFYLRRSFTEELLRDQG